MGWREEAFERGPVPAVVYGSEGVPVDANRAYRALFGLGTRSGPGVDLRVFMHANDEQETLHDAWERVGAGGGVRREPTELRVRAADGSWRRVVLSATGVPGGPEIIVSLLDVTAQREAEAARAREVQYLQSLLDRSADVITVLEADGTWRSTTAQGPRILGFPDGYAPEGGVWALLHPDDEALASAAFTYLVEAARAEVLEPIEVRLATAAGGYRRFELVGVNLLDDPVVAGVVVAARDVTKRHEARVAYAASESRYRDLVARMQEGLWAGDADSVTTFVNPRMAEMLGATPEQVIGTSFFDWIRPEQHTEVEARLEARRRGVTETYERTFLRTDGSEVHTLVSATPTMVDEVMVGAFAAVTDISALKAAQAELDAALSRAQDADRAKSVFLSHVSHQLRTPLNGVLGYAGLLRHSDDDPTAVREFAAEIEFAGRHLLDRLEEALARVGEVLRLDLEVLEASADLFELLHGFDVDRSELVELRLQLDDVPLERAQGAVFGQGLVRHEVGLQRGRVQGELFVRPPEQLGTRELGALQLEALATQHIGALVELALHFLGRAAQLLHPRRAAALALAQLFELTLELRAALDEPTHASSVPSSRAAHSGSTTTRSGAGLKSSIWLADRDSRCRTSSSTWSTSRIRVRSRMSPAAKGTRDFDRPG